ncbi:hypothetical protein DFH09DRAFT_1368133 [Mycena vulgaris]|nr:hypothetical protein DFH09DRAFT_1368133 [Mycena vulgaris]
MTKAQSGLFSAILAALLIESYRIPRPDPGNLTVQLLTQISAQLGAFSHNVSFTAPEAVAHSQYHLRAAHYPNRAMGTGVSPQNRQTPVAHPTRARFGISAVVDLIPLFLHVVLMLFLGGLVEFLLPINHLMTGPIGDTLTVLMTLYLIMTILPIISPDCPYRTSFSRSAWAILRTIHKRFGPSSPLTQPRDAVLSAALEKPATRDRRAFA